MARRPILDMEPYKRMPKAPSGLSRPGQRDVLAYSPPKGPTNITDPKGPGLHGENEGYCGEQNDSAEGYERHQSSGSAGLGGDSARCCGSQGKH
jgi:hypothetical protein